MIEDGYIKPKLMNDDVIAFFLANMTEQNADVYCNDLFAQIVEFGHKDYLIEDNCINLSFEDDHPVFFLLEEKDKNMIYHYFKIDSVDTFKLIMNSSIEFQTTIIMHGKYKTEIYENSPIVYNLKDHLDEITQTSFVDEMSEFNEFVQNGGGFNV